jgi:hypothetical protein
MMIPVQQVQRAYHQRAANRTESWPEMTAGRHLSFCSVISEQKSLIFPGGVPPLMGDTEMSKRSSRFIAVVTLIISMVAASNAVAQNLQFQLINQSGYNITGFFVSPTGTQAWEANLMPQGYVLAHGYYVDVNIRDGLTVCFYDIAILFDDGDELHDYQLNLCELGSYTVN